MEKRTNANYRIIESKAINDKEEIVIGRSMFDFNYVCWWYNKENDSYFWGYYTNDLNDVTQCFNTRVADNKKIKETGYIKETPYKPNEVFDEILNVLDKKELLPGTIGDSDSFIDYALGNDYSSEIIQTGEIDIRCRLNYGGSEGIYLDVYAIDYINDKEINIGTVKTLKDDREAMYKMAKLEADFMIEGNDWIWKHYDELEKGSEK